MRSLAAPAPITRPAVPHSLSVPIAQRAIREHSYSGVSPPGHAFHSCPRAEHRRRRGSAPSNFRRGSAVCAAADGQIAAQLSDEEQHARQRFVDQFSGKGSGEGIEDAALALLNTAASTREVRFSVRCLLTGQTGAQKWRMPFPTRDWDLRLRLHIIATLSDAKSTDVPAED